MSVLNRILAHHGPRPALWLDGESRTYGQVIDKALNLAARLEDKDCGPLAVVAVLAHKSAVAYTAILAAHLAGKGYLPLNLKFPPCRLAEMIRQSQTRTIIVGREGRPLLDAIFDALGADYGLTVIVGEEGGADKDPQARAIDRPATGLAGPRPHRACDTAYLLFTSGSTGTPKGVAISFANLEAYLSHIIPYLALTPDDRASQTFDLTFDLSVHDIFVTWAAGGCLYPVPDTTLLSPARFIRDQSLTAWFSVPSLAMFMARTRTLKSDVFPSLRISLFCGEPLPSATAHGWAVAAPHSRLINLYGPTEATIAISAHEWDRRRSSPLSGIMPIGRVFPGQRHCLLGENGQIVDPPGRGELCLSGSQVTAGYLNAPDKTSRQYLSLPGLPPDPWYRTGDLVEEDETGLLHHLGRLDFQIKVNGYRVELGEIETALRTASGCDGVVAVPWPVDDSGARGIVAFILGPEGDDRAILESCRATLPAYMVPSSILWKSTFPLNANGKIDRPALTAELRDLSQGRASWQANGPTA